MTINRNLLHSRTPLIRTLVIRFAIYPDRLGSSSKFVESSTKIYCLGSAVFRMKYNTVSCFQSFKSGIVDCRAIVRLNFEQVECTIDNAFNLRDLVLQELVKIIVGCYIKDLRLKFKRGFYTGTDTHNYKLLLIECQHFYSKLILKM